MVHYEDGYIAGLLLLPILIFVVETALRYSWHALLIGWNMGSDKNGDIEALDGVRLKRVIKKLKRETRYLLRKQAREYSKIKRKTAKYLRGNQRHAQSVASISEAKSLYDSGKETKEAKETKDTKGVESDGGTTTDGETKDGTLTKTTSVSSLQEEEEDADTTLRNHGLARLLEFKGEGIKKELKKAIRKHRAVIVGDFFIGTCWRLQVAFATVVMAMVATYWLDSVCISLFRILIFFVLCVVPNL